MRRGSEIELLESTAGGKVMRGLDGFQVLGCFCLPLFQAWAMVFGFSSLSSTF